MNTKKMFFWTAVIVILILLMPLLCHADDDKYKKMGDVFVPSIMDTIRQGDVNVLVPRGGQLQKNSSFLVSEPPDEYVARKFIAADEHFKDIEKDIEDLKKEVDDLKSAVDSLKQEKDARK